MIQQKSDWDETEWTTVYNDLDEKMNLALESRLKSPEEPGEVFSSCQVRNSTAAPLYVYHVEHTGRLGLYTRVSPYQAIDLKYSNSEWEDYYHSNVPGEQRDYINTVGQFFVIKCYVTGALVAVIEAVEGGMFHITNRALLRQNIVGYPPEVNEAEGIIAPPDGPRVLVGSTRTTVQGANNDYIYILRTQHWKKTTESYVLAPGDKRTISTTIYSGVQDTSSTSEDVAESIGASASIGWGPLSASINASLNVSSNSFHEVVLTSTESQYRNYEVENPNDFPVMVIHWQICDEITIVEEENAYPGAIVSQISSLENPGILKLYNLENIFPEGTSQIVFSPIVASQ